MPSEYRDTQEWQKYLELARRYLPPKDAEELFRKGGNIDDYLARIQFTEELMQRQKNRDAAWRFLRTVGSYFAIAVGVLATLKAVLPAEILPW